MEIFINEKSLNEQFSNIYEFKDSIIIINSIFSLIDEKGKTAKIYQDSFLFKFDFKAITSETFQISFNKLNPNIQLDFRRFLKERLKAVDWRTEQKHNINDTFSCNELNDFVTNTSLAEMAERNLQDSKRRLLINFTNSLFKGLNNLNIFKNDIENENPIRLECLEIGWI